MSRIDGGGFSRRDALRAGIASGVALAAPWFWVKRAHAAAAFPAFGRAKHVLLLYAGGGLRSAPLFCADVAKQHNPYGRAASMQPGAQWTAGSLLGSEPIALTLFPYESALPPVPAIAADFAMLEGVDHDPGETVAVVDHLMGDQRLATIARDEGTAGLLSIIRREHAGYRDGSLVLPPFDLGLSSFGRATGVFEEHRAICVQSAADLGGRSKNSAEAERATWADDVRAGRDERFLARRAPRLRAELERLVDTRIASRSYAALLRDPALDLREAPLAELGGASNAAMLEVLGAGEGGSSVWGRDVAFALRLFQLGVPAVSVMRYIFDLHSREDLVFPLGAADLGRQLAGLHFLLHRLRDREGAVLWDNTVVLLVSEFSRDNTSANTGLNSGHGSDHQGSPASRNQIWPIFGGPIAAKGRRIGGLDPETLEGPAMSVGSVMATVLALLGIEPSPWYRDAPLVAPFA